MKKKKYVRTADTTRKLVIDYVKANGRSGMTQLAVLSNFGVKKTAYYDMLAAYDKNGRTGRIKPTGRKRAYDKSDRLTLRNLSAAQTLEYIQIAPTFRTHTYICNVKGHGIENTT